MATTFEALGVAPWLREACSAVGFGVPTDIQRHCIPPILQGAFNRPHSSTPEPMHALTGGTSGPRGVRRTRRGRERTDGQRKDGGLRAARSPSARG